MNSNVFPERLQRIRKMRGFSLRDLCAKMEGLVSVQTLSNYEKGITFPDGKVMTALLDALDVRIDTLFRPQQIEWTNIEFHYRKRKTMTQMLGNKIDELVRDFAERYMEIESILEIPQDTKLQGICSNKEVRTCEDARAMAQSIRLEFGLGESPIANMHDFLESAGIKLIGIDVDAKFDGVHFSCGSHNFIAYNSSKENADRTRFTIAHEVGHLFLNIPDEINDDMEEKLCHSFASELLLPSKRLYTMLGFKRDGISLMELKRIQQLYGISVDAVVYACVELGIMPETRKVQYHKWKNAHPEFKEEIERSSFLAEPDNERFESLVFRALSNDVITSSKAAELLEITIDELNKKIRVI